MGSGSGSNSAPGAAAFMEAASVEAVLVEAVVMGSMLVGILSSWPIGGRDRSSCRIWVRHCGKAGGIGGVSARQWTGVRIHLGGPDRCVLCAGQVAV